ncbi:MAG: Rieske (2Fe-2S) protein [Candidatus Rokuibacteriota bacterium]
MTEIRAAALADVPPGQPRPVEANGTRLVLVRVGDQVHALDDVCAHQGGPLSEGKLSGTRLACPWHGWMYDVRTGRCLFPPRGHAVPSYRVRVDGDDVWVDLEAPSDPGEPGPAGRAGEPVP